VIKNPDKVKEFEDRLFKEEGSLDYSQSMKIFTALWQEAVSFGHFPPKDPLEGFATDLKIAKVINSCSKKSWHD
jgi:hypothetical protein